VDGTKEGEVVETNDGETVVVTNGEKDGTTDGIYEVKLDDKVDGAEDGK